MIFFIISHPDVLKKMNGISNERIIQIQNALGVIYTDVDLDGVNIEIVEDIFENSQYELMPVMIKRLFQWKLPENVSLLSSQCYTEILKLEYAPLLGYAHDNFEVFVENNILAVDTNINETSDAMQFLYQVRPMWFVKESRVCDKSCICKLFRAMQIRQLRMLAFEQMDGFIWRSKHMSKCKAV